MHEIVSFSALFPSPFYFGIVCVLRMKGTVPAWHVGILLGVRSDQCVVRVGCIFGGITVSK